MLFYFLSQNYRNCLALMERKIFLLLWHYDDNIEFIKIRGMYIKVMQY